jgi:hypothetical protein
LLVHKHLRIAICLIKLLSDGKSRGIQIAYREIGKNREGVRILYDGLEGGQLPILRA